MQRLPEWSRIHQAPDVIDFADFVQFADGLCGDLSGRWRSWVPHRLIVLPYPNGPKLRTITVARCPDLVLLRAAGGRIAATTDPRLSDRVLSSRLAQRPPGWYFKDPRAAFKRWRLTALAEIEALPFETGAWKTDVENFFGSIDLHPMVRLLHDWRCDLDAIRLVLQALREWSTVVPGLPIGPETSSVLGNTFLEPLDRALQAMGVSHYRYMDDVIVVGRDLDPDTLEISVDQALGTWGSGAPSPRDPLGAVGTAFPERRTVDREATPFLTGVEDTHGIASFRNPLECGVQCHPIDVIFTLGRAQARTR